MKMGIVTMISAIKQIHNKEIVFVKLGKFYHCYGKDAYIVSYFFDYKLSLIENTVYTCGFPNQSLKKVLSRLENKKISYVIIDRRNNYELQEKEDFKNLNTYDKYFEKAKTKIGIDLRIQKINSYLLENSERNNIKEILLSIEKFLQMHEKENKIEDKRRKI